MIHSGSTKIEAILLQSERFSTSLYFCSSNYIEEYEVVSLDTEKDQHPVEDANAEFPSLQITSSRLLPHNKHLLTHQHAVLHFSAT